VSRVSPQPTCGAVHRPAALLEPTATVLGLRAAGTRLSGGTRTVDVWLYGDPPSALGDVRRWSLQPPVRGTSVTITAATVEALPQPHVELTLGGLPDTGRYRLGVHPHVDVIPPDPPVADLVFDPLRTWLPARLRPECPDLGSCETPQPLDAVREPSPVHDLLARDWRSLRRALLEFLLQEDPTADLSPADPTVTMVELFAHVGDVLHYRLDRVATEAYLETARRRTSVRRHARLVDFPLEEATSARTPVLVQVTPGTAAVAVAAGTVASTAAGGTPFTIEAGRTCRAALGEIAVYDWGEDGCCLPAGSTDCVVVRPRPADPAGDGWLAAGDLVVFEVVDPLDRTRHDRWSHRAPGVNWPALTADGDPTFRDPLPSRHAQVVRLLDAVPFTDPLAPAGLPLTRLTWGPQDALRSAYPVAVDSGAGGDEVTVVRANLLPAHQGQLVDGPPGATAAPRAAVTPGPFTEVDLLSAGVPARGGRGVARRADGTPYRLDVDVELPSGDVVRAEVVPSLLTLSAGSLGAVLDTEDTEPPVLRFRTGAVGLAPPLGSTLRARYEVGGGAAGNVAPNSLSTLRRNTAAVGAAPTWVRVDRVVARNPVAATGGRDPMGLDVARRDAPEAFAAHPRRAVLPADLAAVAARDPGVRRAVARRGWSGSWPVVSTVVDLLDEVNDAGGDVADDARLVALQATLDDVRMIGTESAVVSGSPVGLFLGLEVCAAAGADAEVVRRGVQSALRPGTSRRPGLFAPSRLTLGGVVHVSAVLAAAAGVPGVDAVEVREARRLSDPPGTVMSVIRVGPGEVAVLDDDPDRPSRGRLDIHVRGGR